MTLHNKSILFVTSELRQREIKIAHALKIQGWKIDLIYLNSTAFKPEGYFNSVQEATSPQNALQYAKKLKPKIIHVFSGAIDNFILKFCMNKIAHVVIDLNDIFSPSIMSYCEDRFALTQKALSLADGYCARDLQVKYAEKFDNFKIPFHTILFPEYCWDNPVLNSSKKSSSEIHIVQAGTITLEKLGMLDCGYLKLVEMIIRQKIHFHMYPPPYYINKQKILKNDYAQFFKLEKNNSYLHIHNSLSMLELAEALKQYDFGIIAGGCKEFGQKHTHFKPKYLQSCYSGRISDYLDADLPILINKEHLYNFKLLKRYGVYIDLKEVLKQDFKTKLQILKNDPTLNINIQKCKKKLSIENNSMRLTKFYYKVLNTPINKKRTSKFMEKIFKANDIFKIFMKNIRKYFWSYT